jgi:DNA adenine methylase
MLQTYRNIRTAVINDINPDLTTCYRTVRDNPDELVNSLKEIQKEYYSIKSKDEKCQFFLLMREEFNKKNLGDIENTTLFFFLNRTCFNGLYRVNKSGLFNVQFGKYETPTICDPQTIYADSKLLQNVEIITGDYQETLRYANGNSFFYFDPPYRPLSATSNFNDYSKEVFNDIAQRRLKSFCDTIQNAGHMFMLSNSDCSSANPEDTFFEDLYLVEDYYNMSRVMASRNVNANGKKRGKITEIVVRNYN